MNILLVRRICTGGLLDILNSLVRNIRLDFLIGTGRRLLIWKKLIRPETKAIFIETPTNPLMQETDIATVAKWAHAHDLLVIVDNTFYTPVLQQPLSLGADIVIHSATKYLGGHNDVLAGAVIVKEEKLGKFFFDQLNATGTVLSPFDSWLLIRGLKTLVLRVRQHQANAQKIAAFLEEHKLVEEVRYPGRGGMISFFIRDAALVSPLLKELELFTFAESLGGVESLITYPTTQTHADIPVELRNSYGLTDKLLRISVGIEASEDLIADLSKALDAVLEEVSARG